MITVKEHGIDELNRRLAGMIVAVQNPAPGLKLGGIEAVNDVRRNFRESHTPEGHPWLPLKNPSAKRGGASAKPLINKGHLMGGIHEEPGPDGRSFIVSTSAETADYAAAQNFGVPRGYARPSQRFRRWGSGMYGRVARARARAALRASGGQWGIPPRKYMGLSTDGVTKVHDAIARWLTKQLGAK